MYASMCLHRHRYLYFEHVIVSYTRHPDSQHHPSNSKLHYQIPWCLTNQGHISSHHMVAGIMYTPKQDVLLEDAIIPISTHLGKEYLN